MGEIRSLVCVGFLVKVSDTCALVGGAGSCLWYLCFDSVSTFAKIDLPIYCLVS